MQILIVPQACNMGRSKQKVKDGHNGDHMTQLCWIFVKQLCGLYDFCSSHQIWLHHLLGTIISPLTLCGSQGSSSHCEIMCKDSLNQIADQSRILLMWEDGHDEEEANMGQVGT